MTRFTAIALALLLVVPAKADDCPIPTLYPEYTADQSCVSMRCFGMKMLREAYLRGEIREVHLVRLSECQELRSSDLSTGKSVKVPCTWDINDYYRPY